MKCQMLVLDARQSLHSLIDAIIAEDVEIFSATLVQTIKLPLIETEDLAWYQKSECAKIVQASFRKIYDKANEGFNETSFDIFPLFQHTLRHIFPSSRPTFYHVRYFPFVLVEPSRFFPCT